MKEVSLAGCVILYNPEDNVMANIESYINHVSRLYVVDNLNGNIITSLLIEKYDNVEILQHDENRGIAFSLNEVLGKCKGKYSHLLTMDQDSCFIKDSMHIYKDEIKKFDWSKTLGIAPKTIDDDATPYSSDVAWKKTLRVITSGNIISVSNAIKVGGFDEKLFIDEVDFEFCYKGNLAGFLVYITEGIYLKHTLGNKDSFIHKILKCMNHGYVRKYYIVRNRMYVYKKYNKIDKKFFFTYYIVANLKLLLDIVFLENDKFRKLRFYLLGIKDFYQDRMGKVF